MSFPWKFGGEGYIQFPKPSDGGPEFGASGRVHAVFENGPYLGGASNKILSPSAGGHLLLEITSAGKVVGKIGDGTNSATVTSSNSILDGENTVQLYWSDGSLSVNLNGTVTTANYSFTPAQTGYLKVGESANLYLKELKAWSNPNASLDSPPGILYLGPQSGDNVVNLAKPYPMGTAYGGASCLIKPARKGFRPLTSSGYIEVAASSDWVSVEAGIGQLMWTDGPARPARFLSIGSSEYSYCIQLYHSGTGNSLCLYTFDSSETYRGFLIGNRIDMPYYTHWGGHVLSTQTKVWVNGQMKTGVGYGLSQTQTNIILPQEAYPSASRGFITYLLAYILNESVTDYEPTDADIAQLETYLAMGDYSRAIKFLEDKTVALYLLTNDTLEGSPGNYYFPDLSRKGSFHKATVWGTKDTDWEML